MDSKDSLPIVEIGYLTLKELKNRLRTGTASGLLDILETHKKSDRKLFIDEWNSYIKNNAHKEISLDFSHFSFEIDEEIKMELPHFVEKGHKGCVLEF